MSFKNTSFWSRVGTSLTLAVFVATMLVGSTSAQGLDPKQKQVFDNDIQWFNYSSDKVATCGGGNTGPANLTVGKDFNLGPISDGLTRRVNLVKALMADMQLTAEQASGIVGNFMWESGGQHLPPDINQGAKAGAPPNMTNIKIGYGWAQWSDSRKRAFIDYAVTNQYMASEAVNATDAANYAFLKFELNGSYARVMGPLKATNTPEDAAVTFEHIYEAAGKPALDPRKANARQVFTEYGGGGTPGAPTTPGSTTPSTCSAGSSVIGDIAFPLKIASKNEVNKGMFKNGTTDRGGHPYIAFDILVKPGTEVVAFMSGTVTMVTEDRCPGRMLSIYNQESDMTISYLHMAFDNHLALNATVKPGEHVGVVGPPSAGCGTPHLHIDAAKGKTRPGCSRLNCPASNASKFIDIGPQLYTTFQPIPD